MVVVVVVMVVVVLVTGGGGRVCDYRYDLWLNIEQMLTVLVSCWVDNVR